VNLLFQQTGLEACLQVPGPLLYGIGPPLRDVSCVQQRLATNGVGNAPLEESSRLRAGKGSTRMERQTPLRGVACLLADGDGVADGRPQRLKPSQFHVGPDC
jgi:hypothetical protein